MLDLLWLYLFLVMGGLLGGAGMLLVISDYRRRTHTLRWAILIILAPYVGLPLFLFMGMRTAKKIKKSKIALRLEATLARAPGETMHGVGGSCSKILQGMGVPPVLTGHQFTLLPDGIATFTCWMEMIEQATTSIEIETYVFQMDDTGRRIRDALARKACEGVTVRVLIDSIGSHATKNSFMRPLVEAGGEVEWFIPLLHTSRSVSRDTRNHRKVAIFDRREVIAGGSNIGSVYIGPTPLKDRWIDVNFQLRGPAVGSYLAIFKSDWEFTTRRPLPAGDPAVIDPAGDSMAHVIPSGVDVPGDVLYNAVVWAIYEARDRLWITTPYLVPDDPLTHALTLAARRGLDVRVIVPDVSNQKLADIARGPAVRELAQWGVRIVRYTGGMFHAKTIVADDSWALIGSMNTDRRSLFLNFEVMLALYTPRDVDLIAGWNERLMSPSKDGPRHASRVRRGWELVTRLFAPEL